MAGNRRTRGNHEGSIRERRPGVWEARLTVEGKTAYFYATTRADVHKKLTAATHEFHRGMLPGSGHLTVKQYLEQWIQDVKPELEPSTWRKYSDNVRLGSDSLSC